MAFSKTTALRQNRSATTKPRSNACRRIFSDGESSSDDEPVQDTGREQTVVEEGEITETAAEQTVQTASDVIDLTVSPAQPVATEQTVEQPIFAGTLVTSEELATPSPGMCSKYTGADPFSPPLPEHVIKRKLANLEESVRVKSDEIALLRMMLQSREEFNLANAATPPPKRMCTADSASATPDLTCSGTVPDSPPLVLD